VLFAVVSGALIATVVESNKIVMTTIIILFPSFVSRC
jgi:hypothetical protein